MEAWRKTTLWVGLWFLIVPGLSERIIPKSSVRAHSPQVTRRGGLKNVLHQSVSDPLALATAVSDELVSVTDKLDGTKFKKLETKALQFEENLKVFKKLTSATAIGSLFQLGFILASILSKGESDTTKILKAIQKIDVALDNLDKKVGNIGTGVSLLLFDEARKVAARTAVLRRHVTTGATSTNNRDRAKATCKESTDGWEANLNILDKIYTANNIGDRIVSATRSSGYKYDQIEVEVTKIKATVLEISALAGLCQTFTGKHDGDENFVKGKAEEIMTSLDGSLKESRTVCVAEFIRRMKQVNPNTHTHHKEILNLANDLTSFMTVTVGMVEGRNSFAAYYNGAHTWDKPNEQVTIFRNHAKEKNMHIYGTLQRKDLVFASRGGEAVKSARDRIASDWSRHRELGGALMSLRQRTLMTVCATRTWSNVWWNQNKPNSGYHTIIESDRTPPPLLATKWFFPQAMTCAQAPSLFKSFYCYERFIAFGGSFKNRRGKAQAPKEAARGIACMVVMRGFPPSKPFCKWGSGEDCTMWGFDTSAKY